MMIQGVSINEMLNQSITVLTKPSVASFEQFERRGGQREAWIYVGAASALVAVVGLIFGIFGGLGGMIAGLVSGLIPLISFTVFAFLLYFVGRQFGGTGTQDEVFYTVALFAAPILAVSGVVGAIPFLNCLLAPAQLVLAIYQLYLTYLAARSSMNLEQNPAIITVVIAIVVQFLVSMVLAGIVAVIFGVGAAVTTPTT